VPEPVPRSSSCHGAAYCPFAAEALSRSASGKVTPRHVRTLRLPVPSAPPPRRLRAPDRSGAATDRRRAAHPTGNDCRRSRYFSMSVLLAPPWPQSLRSAALRSRPEAEAGRDNWRDAAGRGMLAGCWARVHAQGEDRGGSALDEVSRRTSAVSSMPPPFSPRRSATPAASLPDAARCASTQRTRAAPDDGNRTPARHTA